MRISEEGDEIYRPAIRHRLPPQQLESRSNPAAVVVRTEADLRDVAERSVGPTTSSKNTRELQSVDFAEAG